MLNLASILQDAAHRHPDRVAVVLGDQELTYAEVERDAARVASLLVSWGIRPGDRVAISLPNVPQFASAYYGILKAGAVVVPLNILLQAREVAYHLTDSGANAYLCFTGTADLPIGERGRAGFEEVPGCERFLEVPATGWGEALDGMADTFPTRATSETDTAVVLYTSGTTGRAKGAELSHSNLTLNAIVCEQLFQFSRAEPERMLTVLPLFHTFGATVLLNGGFAVGATLVMMPRFEPQACLRLLAEHRITVMAGVPTMYWALLNALPPGPAPAQVTDTLRRVVSGGSSLPREILDRFADRLGLTIQEGYGLSETSPVASFNPRDRARPGSVGIPVWGVQMKLIDELGRDLPDCSGDVGEVCVRGHNVMKGYLNNPEATAQVLDADGWFRTGDLGRQDEDGYYYLVDRAKDLIVRGGFNVYPREVEEVLMTHPDVSLAAVVGVPDARVGEEVKAFVIPAEGSEIDSQALVAWARENLAGHKYPRAVEVVTELPMTATGKILKRQLG